MRYLGRKKKSFVGVALVALALGLAACGGGSGGGSDSLNAILSLTGPGGPFGKLMQQGAQLATDDVNANGGFGGTELDLNIEDDGSDPARAVTTLQKIGPDTNFVMLGLSGSFAQAAPIANEDELPVMAPAVSAVDLVADNRPWTFGLFPNLADAVPDAVKVWKQNEDLSTISMIYDNQNEATVSQADLYRDAAKQNGLSLAQEVAVSTDDVNFGAAVGRALSSSPDGIVVSALPEQASSIVRTIRQASPDIPVFIPTAGFVPSVLRDVVGEGSTNGIYTVQIFFDGKGSTQGSRDFSEKFKKEYKTEPDGTAALAYEEILILQKAAEDGAYTPDDSSAEARESLRDYLEKLSWKGPFGQVTMGEDGVATRDFYVLSVDAKGETQLVKTLRP